MPEIIKDGQIVTDHWQVFKLAEGENAQTVSLPAEQSLLPLSVWLARKQEVISKGTPIGIWLESDETPEQIAADLGHFSVIAVNFPKFTDGRGFSIARLLRERYAFGGEIRAIGDILFDQLFFLKRCGINAFALRADQNIEKALAGFATISESYQAAADQPQPLFRRRAA